MAVMDLWQIIEGLTHNGHYPLVLFFVSGQLQCDLVLEAITTSSFLWSDHSLFAC